jgi:tetratricopeptide (TPR) repeat protein
MQVERGRTMLDANRPQEALRVLRDAREENGDDVALQQMLARGYDQLQMYDSALVAYGKILELSPDDASALNGMAVIYQKMGQLDRAEQVYERSIASFPNFFQHHLNLAILCHQQQDYARADREFALALKMAPEAGGARQEVRLSMAQSLYRRGSLDEARRVAEEAAAADPRDPRPRQLLAMMAGGGPGPGPAAGGRP